MISLPRFRGLGSALVFAGVVCMQALPGWAQSYTVSEPIGQNLTESISSVAPTSSTALIPGANNLLSPDDRTPIYDTTASNIFSTMMNPQDLTSLVISRTSTQLDGSVKDIIRLNAKVPGIGSMPGGGASGSGARSAMALPSVAFSAISASSVKRVDTASSFSINSHKDTQPANSVSTGIDPSPKSYWVVGKNSNILPSTPLSPSMTQSSDTASTETKTSATGPLRVVGEESTTGQEAAKQLPEPGKVLSVKRTAVSSPGSNDQQTATDTSTSPLERIDPETKEKQDALKADASPFKSLDTSKFLDPDIFSPTTQPVSLTHPSSADNRQSTVSDRLRTSRASTYRRAGSRSGRMQERAKAMDMQNPDSRMESIGTRSEQRLQSAQRPKWHNPLLQQMEENHSPDQ